jgi:hypothetical protein
MSDQDTYNRTMSNLHQSSTAAYECPEHGPFGPARFCCACTRADVEAERDYYLAVLDLIAEGNASLVKDARLRVKLDERRARNG